MFSFNFSRVLSAYFAPQSRYATCLCQADLAFASSFSLQVTLAECYVALFEWGDSRKLPDAVHSLLKVVTSKADTSSRVYVGVVLLTSPLSTSIPLHTLCELWLLCHATSLC